MVNVGKYTIHGSYGLYTLKNDSMGNFPWQIQGFFRHSHGEMVSHPTLVVGESKTWWVLPNPIPESISYFWLYSTLPETNISAPENGWLEDDRFLLGWPIFRVRAVSFRDCNISTSILHFVQDAFFFRKSWKVIIVICNVQFSYTPWTVKIWLVVSSHLKIYQSKWESSPKRDEHSKRLEPPPKDRYQIMRVWKIHLLSNIAMLGIFVKFWGCTWSFFNVTYLPVIESGSKTMNKIWVFPKIVVSQNGWRK